MTDTATFTSEDLRRLNEVRELMKALKELTAKPGNNRMVGALGKILALVDQKLLDLHDELGRRLKESGA